jgi:Ca2+-binding EF-hand superfamily protein
LEQLYSAFDGDNNNAIDFTEFVDGLSVFMKGSPEEKLACMCGKMLK